MGFLSRKRLQVRRLRRERMQHHRANELTALLGLLALGCLTWAAAWAWQKMSPKPRQTSGFQAALERESKKPMTWHTITITVDGQSTSWPIPLPGTNISVKIE